MRVFQSDELLIATHNKGKAREMLALLKPYVRKFYTSADFGLPEPEETGVTFAENAKIKARSAAKISGKVALADDSGLAVNALHGAPGIYSARWAGEGRNFDKAMLKVHESLADSIDRSAYFICVLAMGWPDGHTEVFEGRINGQIVWPKRGDNGFGYDPIFQPDGCEVTFGQIEPDQKHKISHRAKAFKRLVNECFK
ncbi:MAG: RdgB/HAM1 family non-canonical purine NTP pyrophosphatase [Alphaproteobacteria bacterium]|nr:RdgB/HAM1 family non-canonical purine NTP pyrophosphatase [Alphaproteobacteria bacterium]